MISRIRGVLLRGTKVLYVVPAVLAAMRATPAHATGTASGGLAIGVVRRRLVDVPADLLVALAEVEREFVVA